MFTHLYRWLVFKMGDTRWLGWKYFPFLATWEVHIQGVPGVEMELAFKRLKKGDVILIRHNGFISNLGIGGALIHAMLYVGNGEVIEALSDDQGGVVKRHVIDALQSDHLVILRPLILSQEQIDEAVDFAHKLRGFPYDIFFNFNSEEERDLIDVDPEKAKKDGIKICCTELPYLAFIHNKEKLRLYREPVPASKITVFLLSLLGIKVGKEMITADMYIPAEFGIVFASASCKPDWFKRRGSHEAVVHKIKKYWDVHS